MALKTNKISKDIGIWFAELLAIFLGVYLAFLLNGHRLNKQNEHKRQQIYTALYRTFSGVHHSAKYNRGFIKLFVTPYLTAYKNKKMPRLIKPPFFTAAINSHTWNAMLQAGGINLLSVQLIRQISNFWFFMHRVKLKTNHFNELTDQYLIPNLNADLSEFYNLKTKKIQPKYEWYVKYLKDYQNFKDRMEAKSDDILKILKKKMNKKQLQKVGADPAS